MNGYVFQRSAYLAIPAGKINSHYKQKEAMLPDIESMASFRAPSLRHTSDLVVRRICLSAEVSPSLDVETVVDTAFSDP